MSTVFASSSDCSDSASVDVVTYVGQMGCYSGCDYDFEKVTCYSSVTCTGAAVDVKNYALWGASGTCAMGGGDDGDDDYDDDDDDGDAGSGLVYDGLVNSFE